MTLMYNLNAVEHLYVEAHAWLRGHGVLRWRESREIERPEIKIEIERHYEGGWAQFLIDQDFQEATS